MADNVMIITTLTLQMAAGYSSYTPRLSCTQTDNESINVQLKLMNKTVPYVVPDGYDVNIRQKSQTEPIFTNQLRWKTEFVPLCWVGNLQRLRDYPSVLLKLLKVNLSFIRQSLK